MRVEPDTGTSKQLLHAEVAAGHLGRERRDAATDGELAQTTKQAPADPAMLEGVLDQQSNFGAAWLLDHELTDTADLVAINSDDDHVAVRISV